MGVTVPAMKSGFSKADGVTLVELITVIGMTAILLMLAVPSMRDLIARNRAATAVNSIVSSFNLARSEAIKRGTRVTVCKSSDGASCSGDDNWDQGWIVFTEDVNPNAAVDGGETIIEVRDGLDDQFTLVGGAGVGSYVSFVSTGATQQTTGAFQAGTLALCGTEVPNEDRDIVINNAGRISLRKKTCS